MKLLISLCLVFCSLTSYATVKLSAQANMYNKANDTRPQVGVSIYQPMMKNIALNVWSGVGVEPFEDKKDVTWYGTKGQLDFLNGNWTLSPGIMYKDIKGNYDSRSFMYVKVDYKLF
jgi:hypothetical protein